MGSLGRPARTGAGDGGGEPCEDCGAPTGQRRYNTLQKIYCDDCRPAAGNLPHQYSTLSRGGGPTRHAPMRRSAPKRPVRLADPVTEATRLIVWTRCGGHCEACWRPILAGVDTHHRQLRRFGDHTPANLVALHPDCHTGAPNAVHRRVRWARERGLILRSWQTPAAEVLYLPDGRRVLLDPADPVYLHPEDGLPYAV